MTQRERLLAITLGLTLGVLGAGWLVQRFVVSPLVTVRQQIAAEGVRRGELNRKLAELDRVEQDWKAQVARTLAAEPKEAQLRFRENMQMLLERHGLAAGSQDKGAKISPGSIITDNRTGFVDVPLSIQTTGSLRQIVGFLVDFYRQDYAARIDQVSMTADLREGAAGGAPAAAAGSSRAGRRTRSPGPATASVANYGLDGPPVNVTIDVVTLVAPKLAKVEASPAAGVQELESGRLRFPVETYQEIVERSLFAPYVPPPPPPPPPDPAAPPPAVVVEPNLPPPPPPAPLRDQPERQILIGTTVINGVPYAYVLDERDGRNTVTRYGHDARLDGEGNAVVLLIHPRGMVVRARDDAGRATDYFYPLRQPEPASFAERVPLTEEEYPEVVAALRAEFVDFEQ